MFIFKKIISQFLLPLQLVLLISLVGLLLLWFTKRQRLGKIFITAGLSLLLLFSYGIIPDRLLKPLERMYPPFCTSYSKNKSTLKCDRPIQYVVVLGGGHTSDKKVPVTSQIGEDSLVRLIEGIRIYRQIPGIKLILSGGGLFDPNSNASVMSKVAKELGVNGHDIILEAESKDTKDEARLIKPMVGENPFFLVTSASHMPRSIGMFRKLGMNPIPAPTGHIVKNNQAPNPFVLFPNAENLVKLGVVSHEYLGIVWARLRGQL